MITAWRMPPHAVIGVYDLICELEADLSHYDLDEDTKDVMDRLKAFISEFAKEVKE